MNSDLIPPSKPSNSSAAEQPLIDSPAGSPTEMPSADAANGKPVNRQQPIPPPSEPMQYRAIGLVRGRYVASAEQLTQGTLTTADGTELEAVLLGRIISLVRNHLDLAQEHLWVVYPRTGQKEDNLHLQIVGVWEPEKLSQPLATQELAEPEADSQLVAEDGYFSIRGEVIYQSSAEGKLIVRIKQAPRKEADKPKFFKVKLEGVLPSKAVGQFWDIEAKREVDSLTISQGEAIATLPPKPKPPMKKKQYRGGYQGGYQKDRGKLEPPRPMRKTGGAQPVSRPIPKTPTPKPIKRQKPPAE